MCSSVRFNKKRKTVISLIRCSKDYGAMCFFSMQVDVQSIKWISCKGMYKGYRQVLLHEHSGDPTKPFLPRKSDYVLPDLKIDLQGYTLSNVKWILDQ